MRADEYKDSELSRCCKMVSTKGLSGLVAYCSLGYPKKSRSLVLIIRKNFAAQAKGQDEAVENDLMREEHKSMPIDVERQSRVTFGGTKKS